MGIVKFGLQRGLKGLHLLIGRNRLSLHVDLQISSEGAVSQYSEIALLHLAGKLNLVIKLLNLERILTQNCLQLLPLYSST